MKQRLFRCFAPLWCLAAAAALLCCATAAETADASDSASSEVSQQNTPADSELTDGGSQTPPETPEIPSYTVQLPAQTIGAGEAVEFTVVSPEFQDKELPEGYYAGALTVALEGQIIVESGGLLSIGTITVGGPEIDPVIQGTHQSGGLIVVKAGGQLRLTGAVFETQGEGLLIVQEPGGSVVFSDMEAPGQPISWGPKLVDNSGSSLDPIWLEASAALTEAVLPQSLEVAVQLEGRETWETLPLQWDLSQYDGQADGALTLTGSFLGLDGQPLWSMQPLTVEIQWYTPGTLIVVDSSCSGDEAASAAITLHALPEDVADWGEVWGEISRDGKSWSQWENFSLLSDSESRPVGIFYEVESRPQFYRIAAAFPDQGEYWYSEAVLLFEADSEDQGGNHGGSITPIEPDRKPEPPAEDTPSPETPPDSDVSQEAETPPDSDTSPEPVTPPASSTSPETAAPPAGNSGSADDTGLQSSAAPAAAPEEPAEEAAEETVELPILSAPPEETPAAPPEEAPAAEIGADAPDDEAVPDHSSPAPDLLSPAPAAPAMPAALQWVLAGGGLVCSGAIAWLILKLVRKKHP